ncbi:MAG TPA: rod shape-determining protein MreD [Acidimicrobiales bacterium]|nr:rod shape-determining protein MreD [Acidimicrobiales bacterium]
MTAVGRARMSLVIVGALVLQLAFLGWFRVQGVHPDVMVLLAVVAGMVGGPDRGAIVGFVVGLVTDLFLQTPFGLSALTFCLVGYAVGLVQGGVLRTSWWLSVATAAAASAAAEILYALLGGIVGQSQMISDRLWLIAGVVGAANAVLAVPAERAVRWAMELSTSRARVGAVGRWR